MQRRNRLTGAARIGEVHRLGRSSANGLLVIRTLPNGLDHNRFCVVAGKRVGNAVVRNRTKRRLRAVIRNLPIRPGWDSVVMARRGAGDVDFASLERAVQHILRRVKLHPTSAASTGAAGQAESLA